MAENNELVDLLGGDGDESAPAPAETQPDHGQDAHATPPAEPADTAPMTDGAAVAEPAPAVDPLLAVREELVEVEGKIALIGDPHAELAGLEQRRHAMIKAHEAAEEAYQMAMGQLMQAREKAMNARQWTLEALRLATIRRDELLAKLA